MKLTQFEFWLIAGLVGILITTIGWFISKLHSQAMSKLDQLIDKVGSMASTMAVHDEKLISGNDKFIEISDHQKQQDVMLSDLDKRLALLEYENK